MTFKTVKYYFDLIYVATFEGILIFLYVLHFHNLFSNESNLTFRF
jgi:hypothetical protein